MLRGRKTGGHDFRVQRFRPRRCQVCEQTPTEGADVSS
jgi:hypothetical protein